MKLPTELTQEEICKTLRAENLRLSVIQAALTDNDFYELAQQISNVRFSISEVVESLQPPTSDELHL